MADEAVEFQLPIHPVAKTTPLSRVVNRLSTLAGINEPVNQEKRRHFKLAAGAFLGLAIPSVFGATGCTSQETQEVRPSKPYDEAALLRIAEQQPVQLLDPRLSAAHITGKYPHRGSPDKYLEDGLKIARGVGLQTIEVHLSPRVIEETYGVALPAGATLKDVVTHPIYSKIFTDETLKNVIITTQVSRPDSVTDWELSSENPDSFSAERLAATRQEMYEFARSILENYGDNGKKFVIQLVNELDIHLLGESQQAYKHYGEDVPEIAIQNAIKYFDTVMSAIQQANDENPNKEPLQTSIEVYRVLDAMDQHAMVEEDGTRTVRGLKRAINKVIPKLAKPPSLIAYSAYEAGLDPDTTRYKAALDYIRYMAPNSELMIGELGFPEREFNLTDEQIAKGVEERINIALDRGAKFFNYWALLDNECSAKNPSTGQCRGFSLVRSDGSTSAALEAMRKIH